MAGSRPLVLIVDDDPDVLETVKAMLANEPYEVHACASAREAATAIERAVPDFMIIDLMMEELDAGADLVRKIRGKGITAPAYILSTIGDELRRNTDNETLGTDGVLEKPLQKERLLTLLEARLRGTPTGRA